MTGVQTCALPIYLAYDLGPKKIRVNCISAGPVNTLAARGIAGFTDKLKEHASRAALQRNVTKDEVGTAGLFLRAASQPRRPVA